VVAIRRGEWPVGAVPNTMCLYAAVTPASSAENASKVAIWVLQAHVGALGLCGLITHLRDHALAGMAAPYDPDQELDQPTTAPAGRLCRHNLLQLL
jgi:hypothetical protein